MRANEFGVYQYLPKPFDLRELISNVNRAQRKSQIFIQPLVLRADLCIWKKIWLVEAFSYANGISPIIKTNNTGFNILIEGRSGTGKSLVAKVLHDFSEREKMICF